MTLELSLTSTMRLLLVFLLLSCLARGQRPNIIYIMSDDHDRLAISAYSRGLISTPNIDRLAKEGMLFKKAFVGNAICGPSRATLLTGQHSHRNKHIDNRVRFDSSLTTFPMILQRAGYQTAVIGKWHLKSYPAGFDFWKILPGQGLYFQPRMINMQGDTTTHNGYATEVITDEAIRWLDSRDQQKPFMLLLHHKAPHRYFFPPLKYLVQFRNKTFPVPSTLYLDMKGRGTAWQQQTMSILPDMKLSSDLKVDPAYLMDIPELKPDSAEIAYYNAIMNRIPADERGKFRDIYRQRGEIIRQKRPGGKTLLHYKYQWYLQDYLACVASIDEQIGRILDHLDNRKLSRNTAVFYTSDQGMYLGQNGWFDKRFMYDVSMQIPLLVRWPGKIKPGVTCQAMVQNIDFAPTILDLAGEKIPGDMQGLTLKPLLQGKTTSLPRTSLYYHFYESYADHTVLPHRGIRTRDHKLIHFYTVDEWELYDLNKDPGEQRNLVSSTAHKKLLVQMKQELMMTRKNYGDE